MLKAEKKDLMERKKLKILGRKEIYSEEVLIKVRGRYWSKS